MNMELRRKFLEILGKAYQDYGFSPINGWIEGLLCLETNELMQLFADIKALDINIVGLTSDKQLSFLTAGQKVFEEVPHQACQVHWLLEVGEKLFEYDRAINARIRKSGSKIRALIRNTMKDVRNGTIPVRGLQYLKTLEPFIDIVMQGQSKPPFHFISLQNDNKLHQLKKNFDQLWAGQQDHLLTLYTSQIPKSYRRLVQIYRIVHKTCLEITKDIQDLQQGHSWLTTINEFLDPELIPFPWLVKANRAALAQQRLETYIQSLRPGTSPYLQTTLERLNKMAHNWSNYLYTCFNFPFIPRTNNKKERMIGEIKKKYIQITGRRNNYNTLQAQFTFSSILQPVNKRHMCRFMRFNSRKTYETGRQLFLELLAPSQRINAIKRNYTKQLTETFHKLKEEIRL